MADTHTITGRLGRDPEVRVTKNGVRFCNFSVCVSWGKGEFKKAQWYNCTVFEESYPRVFKFISNLQWFNKGKAVTVIGEDLVARAYERNGTTGVSLDMTVISVKFPISIEKKDDGNNAQFQNPNQQQPKGSPAQFASAPYQVPPPQGYAAQGYPQQNVTYSAPAQPPMQGAPMGGTDNPPF